MLRRKFGGVLVGLVALVGGVAPGVRADEATVKYQPGLNPVEFKSGGEKLVGWLHLPATYKPGQKLAAVVVDGPWTQVKEQVGDRYARELADRGLAALCFDHRYWGQSGGKLRSFESPKAKVEDLRAAVAFLRTVPVVDGDKIGGLGVCFGASYVLMAAAEEPNLKAVATVAAWLHDPASIKKFYGDEGYDAKLKAGRAALARYEKDGTVEYVPAGSTTDPKAAMYLKDTSGGGDYYTSDKRGVVKAWKNEFAVMAWVDWLALDSITPVAPKVTVPLLIVHSDQSALPDNAKRFHALAKGPKDLLWTEGKHLDFYDRDLQVTKAADAVAAHFRRALTGADDVKTRAASVAAVKEFLAALEAKDIERFLKVWAEDGVQDMPYAPDGFPKKLEGKAAIAKQYGGLPKNFESMRFPVEAIHTTADPRVVVAEYTGDIKVKATGGKYDNTYVGVFRFNEAGKLAFYREYFDPNVLTKAFGDPKKLGDNFNIEPKGKTVVGDKDAVIGVVNAVAGKADARKWDELRACFADEVDVDYTSVAGGKPGRVKADDLIAGWKVGLTKHKVTKHVVSGHDVSIDGDKATCKADVIATHVGEKDARWTCGGTYNYRLARTPDGWKVVRTTFTMTWEQGDR